MDVIKELLPVVDDFERALKVETAGREYTKGVELIYQRLIETLKKIGWSRLIQRGNNSIRTCTRRSTACRPKRPRTWRF